MALYQGFRVCPHCLRKTAVAREGWEDELVNVQREGQKQLSDVGTASVRALEMQTALSLASRAGPGGWLKACWKGSPS